MNKPKARMVTNDLKKLWEHKMKPTFITLFIVSLIVNIGLVTGWVRIASPEQHQEMAYNDTQRELMQALVEEVE